MSPDTIVPDPTNPQSFNRYSYVRNNPVNFTDPTGHRETDGCEIEGCLTDPDLESFLLNYGNYSLQKHQGFTCDSLGCLEDALNGGVTKVSGGLNDYMTILGFVSGGKPVFEAADLLYGCATGGPSGCAASLVFSGAGAGWNRIDEVFDSKIARQLFGDSCSSACGQMLLSSRGIDIPQDELIDLIGRPATVQSVADVLNRIDNGAGTWIGGGFDNSPEVVTALSGTGSWMANMAVDGSSIQHSVIVNGINTSGNLRILDPYSGTSYSMTMDDFLSSWGGYGVYHAP
ncbi:MAG: hypothetical protein KC433_12315 [Anaerolineales bacterium]|nr:hypothetical protein [Anaerolineales bacterium]MCB8937973.1 hypothetical protein [Ardenticatenaceae bacterium]